MSSYRSSLKNRFAELSHVKSLAISGKSDNTFETAKLIGTLGSSSDPATFKYKNKLDKNDRIDFFRVDLSAGSSFSSTRNLINVKGGNVNVTTFLVLPGAPRQQVDVSNFGSGSNSEESTTPFSNVFGATAQLYFKIRIRRLPKVKKIDYSVDLTFNP